MCNLVLLFMLNIETTSLTIFFHSRCHEIVSIYTWDKQDGINIDLMFLAGTFIVYMGTLVLIEMGITKRILTHLKKSLFPQQRLFVDQANLDEDVVEEKNRVEQNLGNVKDSNNSNVLLAHDLYKNFGKKMVAVNGLTFGVNHGECFGLLGINGAGKTTTFRMLTGDELLTDGTAFLMGTNLVQNRRKFLSMIGYCPQFDSIIDVMTGNCIEFFYIKKRWHFRRLDFV